MLTFIDRLYTLLFIRGKNYLLWKKLFSYKRVYTRMERSSDAIIGVNVRINGKFSGLGKQCEIGDHSSINPGMRLIGRGNVKIGQYDHIG